MSRKSSTVKVTDLIEMINISLRDTGNDQQQYRAGIMSVIETVLHNTKNYKGFRYLTKVELAQGFVPGINTTEEGQVVLEYESRFANTDPTRVKYF
jgi:hypothetical protein